MEKDKDYAVRLKMWQLKRAVTCLAGVFCFTLAATALGAGDEDVAAAHEYSKGVKRCMVCHKENSDNPASEIFQTPMGLSGDPRAPFADGNHDCEACHGPSKSHLKRQKDGTRPTPAITFDSKTPVATQNEVCLGCHNDDSRFHWPGSIHDTEGLACVDCHDRHKPDDPVLSLETQAEVCFNCHKEQRAQFLRQSRHPVQSSTSSMSHTGLMTCTDCHQPHGSAGPSALKRNTINEQCHDCHAEKRGPFLWEHAPVQEDCTNCHTAHGSNYENLLVGRPPWLCQQCHIGRLHSSDVYSGTGLPPGGADPRLLGKQCLNCHSQVHGSNHPAGIRLTR
jgi:DmsE family decaheme c-type cytochrome